MKFLPGEYYLILFDDFAVKDWGDVSRKDICQHCQRSGTRMLGNQITALISSLISSKLISAASDASAFSRIRKKAAQP